MAKAAAAIVGASSSVQSGTWEAQHKHVVVFLSLRVHLVAEVFPCHRQQMASSTRWALINGSFLGPHLSLGGSL